MTNQNDDVLLWGGAAIGASVNLTPQAARRLLGAGKIKCARKQGRQWTAWRNAVRREFGFDGDVAVDRHHVANDDEIDVRLRI
jgi:hypothetical protein